MLIVARGSAYLLVDISNSYCKICVCCDNADLRADAGSLPPGFQLACRPASWKTKRGKVVVSSVVPAKELGNSQGCGKKGSSLAGLEAEAGHQINYPNRNRLVRTGWRTLRPSRHSTAVPRSWWFRYGGDFDIVSERRAYSRRRDCARAR